MKIKCTLSNAGTNINGIDFGPDENGVMVSAEVSEEQAAPFGAIPGYEVIEGEKAPPAKDDKGKTDPPPPPPPPNENGGGNEAVDLSKMRANELVAYVEANPDKWNDVYVIEADPDKVAKPRSTVIAAIKKAAGKDFPKS